MAIGISRNFRDLARRTTALVSSMAVVVSSVMPAYADILLTQNGGANLTNTTITTDAGDPSIRTITTSTISSSVGLNAFSQFSFGAGQTVNLVQPAGTNALVNVVNDASGVPSSVLGTLNVTKNGDIAGANTSKVFLLDHNGFIVGATGTINASALVMSTATAAFGASVAGGDATAIGNLLTGNETLAPSNIEFAPGSNINVAGLELHVGATLIMDGSVTVYAPDQAAGAVPVAVNTDNIPQASGASVKNGVIYFGAKSARIGGTVSAKRGVTGVVDGSGAQGVQGGQIAGRVSSDLTVSSGAVLDVSGTTNDGGSMLFGGGDAFPVAGLLGQMTFAPGARFELGSTGGSGGFFLARGPKLSFGGALNLGNTGAGLILSDETTFNGVTTTNGGDLAVLSKNAITIAAGASINTTSTLLGGDLSLIAPNITMGAGSSLNADVAGTNTGGLIALISSAKITEVGAPVATSGTEARITISSATITGGAVVITALSKTSNIVDDASAASVEQANADRETNGGFFTAAFDAIKTEMVNMARKGAATFSQKIPLQIKNADATASVTITNSAITARGNWKGAGAPDAALGKQADNGFLTKTGLQLRDYRALTGNPLSALTQLPNSFDPTRDALYIHANAETQLKINPAAYLLSVVTAITDTKSTVRIENSALTAQSGDVVLTSTLQDSLDAKIVGSGLKGLALGAIVASYNSTNQMLVLNGSVTANNGAIRAAALTGKSQELTNRIGAGKGGKGAVAVTVSMGNSLTEAAIGGTLTAQSLDLDAETIYFAKTHETAATLGGASSGTDALPSSAAGAARQGALAAKDRLLGGGDTVPSKNKRATALAFDIQLDTNRTYATLGGTYRDLQNGSVATAMAAPDVTVVDAVTVDATQRFARFDEGGSAISRNVQAQMSDLSEFLQFIPAGGGTLGAPNAGTDVALFGSFSMAQMAGLVRAEIGDGATVNAASVTVDALTQYQTIAQLTNFRERWTAFMDELAKTTGGATGGSKPNMPDFDAGLDGLVFITTQAGTKSVQPSTATSDQKFAMGASVNMFETDNTTQAVVGDNVIITTTGITPGDVNVTARQEAVFTHVSANGSGGLPKLNPTGTPGTLVGANVSVPRMLSRVEALVGNGGTITAGNLGILADNDVIQVGVSRAGGSAAKTAINGAVIANIFETKTLARLGETAAVNTGGLRIAAKDSGINLGLAGTYSAGTNFGVGASGVINLISRDTRAEIGNAEVVTLVAPGTAINAQSLTITARNTGIVFGSALAGSAVAGTAAGSATGPASGDNDQAMALPTVFLGDGDNTAVAAEQNNATAPDATGATQRAGWSVSGSVVLNLFAKNNATAGVTTNSAVNITGDTLITAENTGMDIALAGSVALGLGLDAGSNALAGAVAVKKDQRNTRVYLRGATLTANAVTVQARDAARSVNVAVGGAGGANTIVAIAGSVATNVEAGETLVQITGVNVITDTSQSIGASNQAQLFSVAGAVALNLPSGTSIMGVGLGVATINSSRDAKTYVTGSAFNVTQNGALIGASIWSLSELKVVSAAAAGSLGRLSLGGASVSNTVTGNAITQITNSGATAYSVGGLKVTSRSNNALSAYAGAMSVGTNAALGSAIAINHQDGGARTILRGSVLSGQDVQITAEAPAQLTARALGGSGAGTAAAGIGISVNTTGMTVQVDVDGTDVLSSGNLRIASLAEPSVSGLSIAGAVSGTGSVAGTATYNSAANTVSTLIRDQSGTAAPRIFAKGSIAILSQAKTTIALLGGGNKLPGANLNFAAGGTAGIGASITINKTDNQVVTSVLDGANVQGFGLIAQDMGARIGLRRGVVIDAFAKTNVDALAISVGVAGTAALTGIFVYNTLSDDAVTTLGDGQDANLDTIATLDAQESTDLSNATDILTAIEGGATLIADAAQTTQVTSAVENSADNFALAMTLSGGASAGATGTGTLIDSTARTLTNTAILGGAKGVDLRADVSSLLTVYAVGAAGGKGAVAASVIYNSLQAEALVQLTGTNIQTAGTVNVGADVASDITALGGNVAAGGGAGAGSALVNVVGTKSRVITQGTTVPRLQLAPASIVAALADTYIPGAIVAGGDINVNATTTNTVTNTAISGAAAGGFVAFSTAVNLIESVTQVSLGANQVISANNIAVTAVERTRLTDNVGALAAGAAGVGGSLNFVDFKGNATVSVGDDARITALGALAINAQADRTVTGRVGIASVAGASLTAAISIINLGGQAEVIKPSGGGNSSEGSALLGTAGGALGDTPTSQTETGSLGSMASRAGAGNDIQEAQSERSAKGTAVLAATKTARDGIDTVNPLPEPTIRVDNVGVVIGAHARFMAGGAIDIIAQSNSEIQQTVGVVAVGTASLSASIGVTKLASKALVQVLDGAEILSDDAITIKARTGGLNAANSVSSTVFAAAASQAINVGAGVSVIDANTQTDVDIAQGVRIGTVTPTPTFDAGAAGNIDNLSSKLTIESTRSDAVVANVTSLGLSATASIGVTIAKARNNGRAQLLIGRAAGTASTLNAGNILLKANDISRVSATTISAQGGTLAGMSGSVAQTSNTSATLVAINRTATQAATFTLRNESSARSISDAKGLALGALAIGVTIAEASVDAVIATTLNAVTVDAVVVDLSTKVSRAGGTNVVSDALAGSGGVVAGGGAVSRALSNYTVTTTIAGGDDAVLATAILGSERVLIKSLSDGFGTQASSSGLAVGALAVGVVIGEVGQKGGRRAQVLTDVVSGQISSRGQLVIASDNTQNQTVRVWSGSGGLLAGAGAVANTFMDAKSETRIGTAGNVILTAGDTLSPEDTRFNGNLNLRATQDATLSSQLDNTSAALVGVSGATAQSNIASDVDVIVGGGTRTMANFYDISTNNRINRPTGAYNIKSRSGGGLSGAALLSDINGTVASNVAINAGAVLVQIGDPNYANAFSIGTGGDVIVQDKLILDAAGLIAVPVGKSDVSVAQTGSVDIASASIIAVGKLDIYSGSDASVRAEAHSTSAGLAGAASSTTYSTYIGNNYINILPSAYLLSYGDIALRAGHGLIGEETVSSNAESRVFNKTAVPINIDPIADARLTIDTKVNIGANARVIAYQNIDLLASSGNRSARGFGLGKDFYREILSTAASLAGVSLVLDIKRGNTYEVASSAVNVDGRVRSGAYARRVLNLDPNNVLNNALLETQKDSGIYETNADAPDPSLYRVQYNVDLTIALDRRMAELQALIDDAATSAADRARHQASRVVLANRRADLIAPGGSVLTSTVITVDYLRASEGSVRIEAGALTGGATGSLYAAGEADIRIQSNSGAELSIRGLEITDVQGGEITFNDALIAAGTTDYAFGVSYGRIVDNENKISINTYAPPTAPLNAAHIGNIENLGPISNYSGDVVGVTEKGSIYQSGAINAENTTLKALNGSIAVDPSVYLDNKGGSPTIIYGGLVDGSEAAARLNYKAGVSTNWGRNISAFNYGTQTARTTFEIVPPQGLIAAGRTITLLAEYTNINTLIRAGTGSYVVDIKAGIDSVVAGLKAQGGTERTRLDSLASDARQGVVRTAYIADNTNAEIYYNPVTDQIEVEDMKVRGGGIYIVSNVISTGSGMLQAVDGYGSLTLNSGAQTDVVLRSVDLGGSAAGSPLEGLVRITDLSKLSNLTLAGNATPEFLTTDYRSIGGVVGVYDNNLRADGSGGIETVTDQYGVPYTRPNNNITSNFGGGGFSYQPVANRDYVAITKRSHLVKMDQYDIAIVNGKWEVSRLLPLSQWYRTAKVDASTAGVVANSGRLLNSAQYGRPTIQNSQGDYAYKYSYELRNWRLGQGATSYQVTDAQGQIVQIDIPDSLSALANQPWSPATNNAPKDGPNAPFTRAYNDYPTNQSHYGLLYEIDPTLRSVEGQLNKLHKIIDMRSALFYEVETSEYRFKADYNIGVGFTGSQTVGSNITTNGNVILADDFFNRFATTSITSQNGSILTGSNQVDISSGDLTLAAPNGHIGGIDGAMRLKMTQGAAGAATVSATAATGIELAEITGALRIRGVTTTARGQGDFGAQIGGINLKAAGDIAQVAGDVTGSDITLSTASGAIYREDAAQQTHMQINLQGGRLNAQAQGNILLAQTTGDMGVDTVSSNAGSVTLTALSGRILDRSNLEVRDTRTLAQLNDLWANELALTDTPANSALYQQRRQDHIDALERQNTVLYRQYWQERTTAGGAPVTYSMDAQFEVDMRASALSDSQVDQYIAQRQALYSQWNVQTGFDAGYTYQATADDIAAVTRGTTWTVQELTTSIRAGLVLETADTKVRLEDPNIRAAGDITITARDGVGEITAPYVLVKPAPGAALTAQDLAVLALADKADFDIDGDGTPDVDSAGNTLIRQEEDLNFAFSQDAQGRATGALRVQSTNNEIYLAAETAAQIAQLQGTGAVELRINGLMSNAGVQPFVVTGKDVVLESGSTAGLGDLANPLTVKIAAGGTLSARSGVDLYITAPADLGVAGDLPLAALFAAGKLVVTAAGAITDAVASTQERVVAGGIALKGGSVGASGAPLGLRLINATTGRVSLTSTTLGIDVFTTRDITLTKLDSATSGSLATRDGAKLSIFGANVIRFAGSDRFVIDLNGALDLTSATGTDVTGQTLGLKTAQGMGTTAAPLTTKIANLDFAPGAGTPATRAMTVAISNTGNLAVSSFVQTPAALSQSRIATTGDLTVSSLTSSGQVDLVSGGTLDITTATAGLMQLVAAGNIGAASTMALSVDELDIKTTDGSARAVLSGRDVAINRIDLGGTSPALNLTVNGGDTLLRRLGITTKGTAQLTLTGKLNIAANTALSSNASFTIAAGDDITMAAGSSISSGLGAMQISTTGDLVAARISSLNATDTALSITVGGALSAVTPAQDVLIANAATALTTLRLGSSTQTGADGLKVALGRLDVTATTGDLHLSEADAIVLESVTASDGSVDVFAGGNLTARTLTSTGAIVVASQGDVIGDNATLGANEVFLFAFGGSIRNAAGANLTADSQAGARLNLSARDNLGYSETSGSVDIGYALARDGDLTIAALQPGATIRVGLPGAGGRMSFASAGDININILGTGKVDVIDEVARKLAYRGANPYGIIQVSAPRDLSVQASGAGSKLRIGLGYVKGAADLAADVIDANLYDPTPADGLILRLGGVLGAMATRVDVNVIGDGPAPGLLTPPYTTPDLTARLLAKTRPVNPSLASSTSVVTLAYGRFDSGEVTHAGPGLVAQDVIISNQAWFRQKTFDLFAETSFGGVNQQASAQMLALETVNGILTPGLVSFEIRDDRQLTTAKLVINRRLEDVGLNGGRSVLETVLVEQILSMSPRGARNDKTLRQLYEAYLKFLGKDDQLRIDTVSLPLVLASN